MNLVKINHQLPDLLIAVCDVTTKMADTLKSYIDPAPSCISNQLLTSKYSENCSLDDSLMATKIEDLPGFR